MRVLCVVLLCNHVGMIAQETESILHFSALNKGNAYEHTHPQYHTIPCQTVLLHVCQPHRTQTSHNPTQPPTLQLGPPNYVLPGCHDTCGPGLLPPELVRRRSRCERSLGLTNHPCAPSDNCVCPAPPSTAPPLSTRWLRLRLLRRTGATVPTDPPFGRRDWHAGPGPTVRRSTTSVKALLSPPLSPRTNAMAMGRALVRPSWAGSSDDGIAAGGLTVRATGRGTCGLALTRTRWRRMGVGLSTPTACCSPNAPADRSGGVVPSGVGGRSARVAK